MQETITYQFDLQRRIETDICNTNLAIGSEHVVADLAERYHANPTDVHLVTPMLHRKGLIKKLDQEKICILGLPSAEIESVFQYAQKANLKPRTIVREVSIIVADASLAENLDIEIGAALYQQIRTRLIDDHVLANQYNFIPYGVCPGLETVDLSQRSFQVTLEEDYHTIIKRIEETYSLGEQSRDDAEILDLAADQKVVIVQRMSYSANEMALVFADIHVNPSMFHYVEALWPEAAILIAENQKRAA